MFTIRCTKKLLRRVDDTETPTASTTVLGDWYAKVLYSRPHQLVLCVSERSLLPVVLHAKEWLTFALTAFGRYPMRGHQGFPGQAHR